MFAGPDNTEFSRLVAQAADAERAGVFSSTDLDVAGLMAGSAGSRLARLYEKALVGLPLAACLGVVVGIASFAVRNGGDAENVRIALLDTNGQVDSAVGLNGMLVDTSAVFQCVSGPSEAASSECQFADMDADGDVDLLDVGSYQRLASGMN